MRPPKRNKLTEAREILSGAVKIQSPWRKISEDLLGKVDAYEAECKSKLPLDTNLTAHIESVIRKNAIFCEQWRESLPDADLIETASIE